MKRATLLAAFTALAHAQQRGGMTQEQHPSLTIQECTNAGGCVAQQKSVVIDANWRWAHQVGTATNCYTGASWDANLCPDAQTCTQNCAIEGAGAEYRDTYGVNADGDALRLNFVTQGAYAKNVGSRVFLLDSEERYKMFQLKNKEFTFDVDLSSLPCGLNGALYFVQMDADGGMQRFPSNKAGAEYGTGYCDAQCPHDIKFINGVANSEGWTPSATDPNAGQGKYGSCCTEFDVWEANTEGMAYTAHACAVEESYRCEGTECGDGDARFDGVCDKNGCDFHTYRLGNTTFWGNGAEYTLDSSKPMTVTTQFITDDGTDNGRLVEIKRHYTQNGVRVETPSMLVGGAGPHGSLTEDYCKAEEAYFNDGTTFLPQGGFDRTDKAMSAGMVLTMSLWDDHAEQMLWLDSTYPAGSDKPGAARGRCAATSGVPDEVEAQHADAYVKFSKIRFGEIGSTDGSAPAPGPAPQPPVPSGCPGGGLGGCINLCPSTPDAAFKACVDSCVQRCPEASF